jgi:Tol biopolymer transport system component
MSSLLDTVRAFGSGNLSPDGQKLALTVNAANDDIWIYNLVRGTLTRLTFGGGNNDFPIWSSDGKYILYQAEKGKAPNLFWKAWDGSGPEERLTSNVNAQLPFSFTPDGKAVAFGEGGDIWMLPMDGERKPQPFIQSSANKAGASFSPNGRWMAYNSDESGRNEVYVVPYPKRDGKWQISTGGGVTPLWSADGRELLYLNGSSLMKVDVSTQAGFDFSVPKKLCNLPSSVIACNLSPDSKRLVVLNGQKQQFTATQANVVLEWFREVKDKFAGAKN